MCQRPFAVARTVKIGRSTWSEHRSQGITKTEGCCAGSNVRRHHRPTYKGQARSGPPRRSKATVLEALKESLGTVKLSQLNRERLIEFGRKRAKQGAGPATLAIDFSFIRTVATHAAAVHGIEVSAEEVRLARFATKHLVLVGNSEERDRRPTSPLRICAAGRTGVPTSTGHRTTGRAARRQRRRPCDVRVHSSAGSLYVASNRKVVSLASRPVSLLRR